jgi:hypothetical protein
VKARARPKVKKIPVKAKAKPKVKTRARKKAPVGGMVIRGKSFDNPESVAAYYRAEGQRVKQAMRQFKVDEAQGRLGIAKSNFLKIQTQKRKLGVIEKDLKSHKDLLDKKILSINSARIKQEGHSGRVLEFMRKMKSLENESKKLIDTRESLIKSEEKLVSDMKDLAKTAQGDLNMKDLKSVKRLLDFEDSKEAALMKARGLLSGELRDLYSDNVLIEDLDKKAHNDLIRLNDRLANIQGSKKEALQKMHLLEMSEKEVKEKLFMENKKVRQLEDKYEKLLKK